MLERTVILATRNRLDWRGNGGSHRALQIAELIQKLGVLVRVPDDQQTSRMERHLRGIILKFLHGYPVHLRRQALSNAGHVGKAYAAALSPTARPCALIWEDITNTVAPFLARRVACPVVAMPQNLDALVNGFSHILYGYSGFQALERDLAFLRNCDSVFCISREEQWFLRVQGIDAEYLPYYPPRQLEDFLLDVRRSRKEGAERRFLLLGTANYEPTAKSLAEQVRLLGPRCAALDCYLDIAGFGTERLDQGSLNPRVRVHGSVTQERLRELLTAASAAILHQVPGVGALTRIPEFLVAGVPIIANVDASRGAWTLEGIARYESLEELEPLLSKALPCPPKPARPAVAERRFLERMQGMLKTGRS